MNILAIVGSPRKGKATDSLVDKAIEGVKAKHPNSTVTKINLVDYNIQYCKNCLTCRDADTDKPLSKCIGNVQKCGHEINLAKKSRSPS